MTIRLIDGASADAEPAIDPTLRTQPTSPYLATGSCAVEIGLPTSAEASAAVPSASITADAFDSDAVTGVSSLPPLSLLAPAIMIAADGHAHPVQTVQPTSCKSYETLVFICSYIEVLVAVLTDATNNSESTSESGHTQTGQTTSNSNDSAKRILMRPSKVINGR